MRPWESGDQAQKVAETSEWLRQQRQKLGLDGNGFDVETLKKRKAERLKTGIKRKPGEEDPLIAKLKAMLRSEEIAADARFAAIGVNSIMAVKLAAELKRQFNIGISPQWFVRYPSVDRMAEEIERCRSERV